MTDLVSGAWTQAQSIMADIWPIMVLPLAVTMLYVFSDVFLGGGSE
jgi:hypothetical protein